MNRCKHLLLLLDQLGELVIEDKPEVPEKVDPQKKVPKTAALKSKTADKSRIEYTDSTAHEEVQDEQ